MASSAEQAAALAAGAAGDRRAGAQVLLIEDEPGIVDFVRRGLEGHGFRVSAETDGLAGERAALDEPVDVVVLDLMLPRPQRARDARDASRGQAGAARDRPDGARRGRGSRRGPRPRRRRLPRQAVLARGARGADPRAAALGLARGRHAAGGRGRRAGSAEPQSPPRRASRSRSRAPSSSCSPT